jgi:putative iron-regulated protein
MTKRTTMLLASFVACTALFAGACSSDENTASSDGSDTAAAGSEVSDADKEAVATHYADGVYASYQASIASATALQESLVAFTTAPTDETLAAARQQWLDARDDYAPTEAFRFYDGPIDNPDDGPEGRINAWPMDEAFVDYVDGDETAGIINNAADYPEITTEVLVSANEDGGETNISTGWHAIEFLLWGQDLSETGPGARPVTRPARTRPVAPPTSPSSATCSSRT